MKKGTIIKSKIDGFLSTIIQVDGDLIYARNSEGKTYCNHIQTIKNFWTIVK